MAVVIDLPKIFGQFFEKIDDSDGNTMFCGHGEVNVISSGRRITLKLKGIINTTQKQQQLTLYGQLLGEPVGLLVCSTQLVLNAAEAATNTSTFQKRELTKGKDYQLIETIAFSRQILREFNVKSTAQFYNSAVEYAAKYRIQISNCRFEFVATQSQMPRFNYANINCIPTEAAKVSSKRFKAIAADGKTYWLHYDVLAALSPVLRKHYEGITSCVVHSM